MVPATNPHAHGAAAGRAGRPRDRTEASGSASLARRPARTTATSDGAEARYRSLKLPSSREARKTEGDRGDAGRSALQAYGEARETGRSSLQANREAKMKTATVRPGTSTTSAGASDGVVGSAVGSGASKSRGGRREPRPLSSRSDNATVQSSTSKELSALEELRAKKLKAKNKQTVVESQRKATTSNRNRGQSDRPIQRNSAMDSLAIHKSLEGRGDTKEPNKELLRLIKQGATVNKANKDGDYPLHVAARQFNVMDVQALLAAGAKPSSKNRKGHTALECAVSESKELTGITSIFGGRVWDKPMPKECDVMPPYETILALVPNHTKDKLFGGWMPPRMREMLRITADLEGDELRDNILRYVPETPHTHRSGHGRHGGGVEHRLLNGFRYCFRVIAALLRYGVMPSVENVLKAGRRGGYTYDQADFGKFIEEGGKVEFVLDALLDITERVYVLGDDGWEYEAFEENIDRHVETPFDGMYDLAAFMLINRGGGALVSRGPHEFSAYDSFALGSDRDYYCDY